MTECIPNELPFQSLGSRDVVARFDGGLITSDAGALLLREVEAKFRFIDQFASCFSDHRDPELVEHPLIDLLPPFFPRCYPFLRCARGLETLHGKDEQGAHNALPQALLDLFQGPLVRGPGLGGLVLALAGQGQQEPFRCRACLGRSHRPP
jgi:hypothetical protein